LSLFERQWLGLISMAGQRKANPLSLLFIPCGNRKAIPAGAGMRFSDEA
jgi:hypothetical protein